MPLRTATVKQALVEHLQIGDAVAFAKPAKRFREVTDIRQVRDHFIVTVDGDKAHPQSVTKGTLVDVLVFAKG